MADLRRRLRRGRAGLLGLWLAAPAVAGPPGEASGSEAPPGEAAAEEPPGEAAGAEPSGVEAGELVAARTRLTVRAAPDAGSRRLGLLEPGAPLWAAVGRLPGPGCDAGWAALRDGGYACGAYLGPASGAPQTLPLRIAFDPPEPEEYAAYRDSGSYAVAPVEQAPRLLPFIYGKRWRHWRGHVYASAAHYGHGDTPSDQLDPGSKLAFLSALDTPRGQVLVREDGTVVPVEEVFLYPVDRFQGRDLEAEPVAEGRLPAFVHGYAGAQVRAEAGPRAEVVAVLPFHAALEVEAVPADAAGRWWRLAPGQAAEGYVDAGGEVRVWGPAPPPAGLEPGALWLDVDTQRQLLAVREGEAVRYLTLVSTGTGGRYETPVGLYRLTDKAAWGDMESLPGAEEEYHVEKVPWIAHFWPRYALHGVFWHWGYGNRASHGCINLAPRDAAWIFERIQPALPAGWHTAWAGPDRPGTLLRVRHGDDWQVRDRTR